ncbi:Endonuclease/exonuclease/phosphatase superfamily [Sesbania bispinosa]|nr:Endonuclease/exonuclease/phosphatase superfamily [Sesbania bispinosa]
MLIKKPQRNRKAKQESNSSSKGPIGSRYTPLDANLEEASSKENNLQNGESSTVPINNDKNLDAQKVKSNYKSDEKKDVQSSKPIGKSSGIKVGHQIITRIRDPKAGKNTNKVLGPKAGALKKSSVTGPKPTTSKVGKIFEEEEYPDGRRSPRLSRRQTLWDEIIDIVAGCEDSWCVIGDFNTILSPHDQFPEGGSWTWIGVDAFRRVLQSCNHIDMGYKGEPFTWRRGQLQERLDRGLMNVNWRSLFSEATISHLPQLKSDHNPLLLQLKKRNEVNKHRRPFRFIGAWLSHPDFENFVKDNWLSGHSWASSMSSFQDKLHEWNRKIFGNIFRRK